MSPVDISYITISSNYRGLYRDFNAGSVYADISNITLYGSPMILQNYIYTSNNITISGLIIPKLLNVYVINKQYDTIADAYITISGSISGDLITYYSQYDTAIIGNNKIVYVTLSSKLLFYPSNINNDSTLISYLPFDTYGLFTLNNSASISTSNYQIGNGSLSLIGPNQYVTISSVITNSGGISFSFWMQSNNSSGTNPLFNFSDESITSIIGLGLINNSIYLNLTKQTPIPIPQANGIYACKLININYTGPIFNIRRSTDNVTADFYSNVTGTKIGTSYNGTGTQISTWLNGAIAYITTWYDQSLSNKHATQTTTSLQPSFNPTNLYVDFNNPSNSYFNLPNSTLPTGNSAYTVIMKHGVMNTQNGGWLGSDSNNFRRSGTTYVNYWYGNDLYGGTYADNNVVTFKYNGTTTFLYVNSVSLNSLSRGAVNTGTQNHYLGCTQNYTDETFNGQLYYVYIFPSALSDTDRVNMETDNFILSTKNLVTNTYNITDNKWKYYTWLIQPNGINNFYVNNALVKTISSLIYPTSLTRNINYIGKSNTISGGFTGFVDDFRMYNRLLTISDIVLLYNYRPAVVPIANNNYQLVSSIMYGSILPKLLTPQFTVIPKYYDTTTNAYITYTLDGIYSGDFVDISSTYTVNYIDPNASPNKLIVINNLQTYGSTNYTVSISSYIYGPLNQAIIIPKFNIDKIYDKTTNLTINNYQLYIQNINPIGFTNDTLIATGSNPTIVYSYDYGNIWFPTNSDSLFTQVNGVLWNGTIFVAVGSGLNTLGYSYNSKTWYGLSKLIFTTSANSLAWSSTLKLFVVVGSGLNTIAVSSDGINWTGLGQIMFSVGNDVKWANNMFLAAGNNSFAYSYNGYTWFLVASPFLNPPTKINYSLSSNQWLAVSATDASGYIGTSLNGINWSLATINGFGNTYRFNNIYSTNTYTYINYYNTFISAYITAIGATINTTSTNTIYTFSGLSGSFSVSSSVQVRILAVGGGGAGGYDAGGGGGGGGVIDTTVILPGGTYNITIGTGGLSYVSYSRNGGPGGNTTFGSILTAYGGGGGGNLHAFSYGGNNLDVNGASGGGQGSNVMNDAAGPGTGIAGQGYAGGSSTSVSPCGGGGGGAGSWYFICFNDYTG